MKGIFILSYHKKPGSFIDREYPHGISEQLQIDSVDQNKIYSFNRMRNSNPNYIYMKIKGAQIGSFFSGIDNNYIGIPNQCVCIILENENPTLFEEPLKKIAEELLPMLAYIREEESEISKGLSKDPKYQDFDEILGQKFNNIVENFGKSKDTMTHSITHPPKFESNKKDEQYLEEKPTEDNKREISAETQSEQSNSTDIKKRLNNLERKYEEKIALMKNELIDWKNKVRELTEEKVSLTHKIEDIEEKYRNQKDKALIWKKQLETANEINVKLKDSV
ncbi:MAG: hypothetical protein ACTSXH_00780, partial [Promethearchaeota archaeon]